MPYSVERLFNIEECGGGNFLGICFVSYVVDDVCKLGGGTVVRAEAELLWSDYGHSDCIKSI